MELARQPLRSLREIRRRASETARAAGRQHLVVAPAPDVHTARGVHLAAEAGLVNVTVIGRSDAIERGMEAAGFAATQYRAAGVESDRDAVLRAARFAEETDDVLILPGAISVPDFFRALFARVSGFRRREEFLSLIGVMQRTDPPGLFLVSDVGLVPDPTVEQGIAIIENAVLLARILGRETVRVGLLAFEDDPTVQSPTTIAESLISKYFLEKGDPSVCVEGPIRLDRALRAKAIPCLPIERIEQGPADVLIANNIHVGNSTYKAMVTLCGMESAPVVIGGRAPIALPSSSESAENILNSLALSVIVRRSRLFNLRHGQRARAGT